METYHPGLFWYQTQSEWDSLFQITKATLEETTDLLTFYRQLVRINANIGCGHTRISLDREISDGWADSLQIFPSGIKLIDGRTYLSSTIDPAIRVKKGDEIISINGIETTAIIEKMLPYVAMDGFNKTGKYRYIERRFPLLYPALMDPTSAAFSISYRNGSNSIEDISLKGISFSTYENNIGRDGDLLQFREVSNAKGAYYLRIKTFSSSWMRSEGHDYQKFLQESFAQLMSQKATDLILDLRGNGGGDDGNGSLLMSFFMDTPFGYYKSIEVLKDYDGWGSPKLREDGKYYVTTHQDIGIHQPKENPFAGKTYILIDGGSFSATSEFAALMHHHQKATFIGEETGGGYYGNTSGNRRRVTLNNTKISASIPYWRYLVDVEGDEYYGRGVIPDLEVKPTPADLKMDRDTVLDFTVSLISR